MIRSIFQDAKRSGVYKAPGRRDVEAAARSAGLESVALDLSRIRDRTTLLERIGKVLEFPGWYGVNWDALEDCLTDLSWRASSGEVLVLEGEAVMDLPSEDRETFLQILGEAGNHWAQQGRPFFSVFMAPTRVSAPDLPDFST